MASRGRPADRFTPGRIAALTYLGTCIEAGNPASISDLTRGGGFPSHWAARRCPRCRPTRAPSPKMELKRLRQMFAQEIADDGRRKSANAAFEIIEKALTEALPAAKREQKRVARRAMRKGENHA